MNGALLGEGNSDRALLPLLSWVVRNATDVDATIIWIDPARLPPARGLADKARLVHTILACDLLFVHRDADKQPADWRYAEIRNAVGDMAHVPVVPVRMTEAWLLPHESAIREASGRVSGRDDLALPPIGRIEDVADPKAALRDALLSAHGATGRRRSRFDPGAAIYRLADLVEDWSPLRRLPSFRRLEQDTRAALAGLGHPLRPPAP